MQHIPKGSRRNSDKTSILVASFLMTVVFAYAGYFGFLLGSQGVFLHFPL